MCLRIRSYQKEIMPKLKLDHLLECILVIASGGVFVGISIRNQYIYQIISEKHNFTANSSVHYCSDNASSSSVEKKIVTDQASQWQMYIALASGLPAILSSTLLTSWSDKVGRKLVLFFPLVGYALSNLMLLFIITYRLPLYWVVISSFLYGVTGSFPGLLNICMAYVSDITTKEEKIKRYTLVECGLGLGGGVFSFVTGFWINSEGFFPSACLAAACSFTAVFLVPFFLPASSSKSAKIAQEHETEARMHPDSSQNDHKISNEKRKSTSCNCEKISNTNPARLNERMKLMWQVYMTENSTCNICNISLNQYSAAGCPHGGGIRKGRVWRIWFYLLSFNLFLYPVFGSSNVDTMYFVSYPLCFTPAFIGIRTGLAFGGIGLAPLVVHFWKFVFRWRNGSLILLGISSYFLMNLSYAVAVKPQIVFAATTLTVFSQVTVPVLRSQISSLASDFEQGAALGFISGTENFTNMLANISYVLLYPITLTILRGFIWMYSSAILLVPLFLMGFIFVVDKRTDVLFRGEDERSPLLNSE